MKFDNISNYTRGWIFGDFSPSLHKTTNTDIGVLFCKAGEKADGHTHHLHIEYNIIITGCAKIDDKILRNGDIFVYYPLENSNVEYLEDTHLLVVKIGKTKNDKHMGYAQFGLDDLIRNNFFLDKEKGVMIEVGAGWPELNSQSKLFRDLGWRVVSFEPEPKLYQMNKDKGHEVYQYAISDKTELQKEFLVTYMPGDIETTLPWTGFHPKVSEQQRNGGIANLLDYAEKNQTKLIVDYYTLNDILGKLNVDTIDYLSVDVEGWELSVLRGIDLNKYTPKVILVENTLNNPEYNEYLSNFGYQLVGYYHNQDQLYVKTI